MCIFFFFLQLDAFIYLFFKFYFIFKIYNIVWVLPNIEMNLTGAWLVEKKTELQGQKCHHT